MPRQVNRAARVQIESIPPPVGGLNSLDSEANMAPTDALILDNYFPGTSGVPIRNGYANWATAITGNVETLAPYSSGTQNKLFGIAGGSVYDVTSSAPVGAPVVTGLSNSRFQTINFGNVGEQFLVGVNGIDDGIVYDGTTWERLQDGTGAVISSITAVGTLATLTTATAHGRATGDSISITGATPAAYNVTATITVTSPTTFTFSTDTAPGGPATVVGIYVINGAYITGVDPKSLVHVTNFANRLWFAEADSMRAWYLPVSQIGGAAAVFDVTSQFSMGGYLMGMCVWNLDDTAGMNPYIVFMSSNGEAVVYQGSDPTQDTTFSIAARFRIGAPVGRRFFEKFGSDLIFIGSDGLVPFSQALITDRSSEQIALTKKISPSVNADVMSYGSNFGWQPVLFPDGNKLVVNVPTGEDVSAYQYVMNTLTNAWCRFTGWNAFCFCYFNKNLYFGSAGFVAQADVGTDDGGLAINSDIKPAFNYLGLRGTQKLFKMMRPVFLTTGPFAPQIDLSADFSNALPSSTPTFSSGTPIPWDTTPWDAVPWGNTQSVQTGWESINGLAYAATYRMRAQTKGIAYSILSTDFMFEPQKTPTF